MNIEAQELADNLRATARAMEESAKKTKEFWKKYHEKEPLTHSIEMSRAANLCDRWAAAIEAEYCGGDEA